MERTTDVRVPVWLGLGIIDNDSGCGAYHSPVQWVLHSLSPGVKGPRCEAGCSIAYGAEVNNA